MEARTTHYALIRRGEENQQLHRLLLLLVNTTHGENLSLLEDSMNNAHSDQWESPLFYAAENWYYVQSASIYHATCRYCWLSMLWGVILQHTSSPLDESGRSATGYLNIRGSQEHPFIVPAHAPLQIDFLQQAHAHATRPQMPPWTGQWNQLTALTCSVTRSQLSICRMTRYERQQGRQRGFSKDSLTQKPEL